MSDGEYPPTKTLVGEASKVAAFWAQGAIELEEQLTAKDAEIAELKAVIKANDGKIEQAWDEADKLQSELAEAQRRIGELEESLRSMIADAFYVLRFVEWMDSTKKDFINKWDKALKLLTTKASANEPMASGEEGK